MGGAMDLVSSQSRVIVTMEHTDRKGNPKVRKRRHSVLTHRVVWHLRAVLTLTVPPYSPLLLDADVQWLACTDTAGMHLADHGCSVRLHDNYGVCRL